MRTLHLLPGESRGDTAEIVLTRHALELLIKIAVQARDNDGYACERFTQRDGSEYSLCIDVVQGPGDSAAWRDRPLAYLKGQVRSVRYDSRRRPYDAELLASHLYAARKTRRHTQQDAAAEMGLSLGFVSHVENCKTAPHAKNFERLCNYIGTRPGDYPLDP